MKKNLLSTVFLFTGILLANSQLIPSPHVNPSLKSEHWKASWVKVPGTPSYDYGVYFFRNTIELKDLPEKYIIHVSADNRYKLFVNGKWIGLGPARCDADNWIYETYDIAGYLRKGTNIIGAQVWNFGEFKPWAQISLFTAFIVQGDSERTELLNTPGTWKCKKIEAYNPELLDRGSLGAFKIVGPGDHVDGSFFPWNWEKEEFSEINWVSPEILSSGAPKGVGTDITHALIPRTIPSMELRKINAPKIRQIDNKDAGTGEHKYLTTFEFPANSKTKILLDQEELVTAYPIISVSGGENAKLRLTYAEALYDEHGKKQNRDSIEHMEFKGNSDVFISDGEENRTYTTLWFRTFRYILVEIETGEDALIINSLTPIFTAYPFQQKAYFESNDPMLNPLWDVAWRTARLCANEIYYDCPYYEQMQYVGDTRIQSLISLYISGDDRLMKKAINDYFNSINPEGLTQSRYPTEPRQIIPTFSLFWVSMIHDYLWHRSDYLFATRYLVSIQHALQWFENHIDEKTGMLGPLEYWPFVDWAKEWPWDNEKRIGGVPPGGQSGNSSIITLQYAMTLDQAADIFSFYGLDDLASEYLAKADMLIESTRKNCWDKEKQLFADTPEMESYSQHANTFALLTNAIPKDERALFMEKVIRDTSLIQASIYFRFYLHRAAIQAGLGNKYLTYMEPWYKMINRGLTTFAEIPDLENTRSDCHAWSSSPLYELLATVAGIRPAAVGFESVIIEPHPGSLEWIKAGMPHYYGDISIDLKFDKKGDVNGTVSIPPGLKGIFVWDNQTMDLIPGKQRISMKSMDSRFNLK